MAKFHLLKDEMHNDVHGVYLFYCPGCETYHYIHTLHPNIQGVKHEFNENLHKPTVIPSIIVNKGNPESHCHGSIKNGDIKFATNCYHHLKGLTVEIPDWEDIENT